MNKYLWLLVLTLCAGVTCSFAQTVTSSPYSRYGIGELQPGTFAQNIAMGHTGVGFSNPYNINPVNPASYYSIKLTTLEAAFNANFFTYKTTNDVQKANSTSLTYLALAFPIWAGKIGASAGLTPYSGSGYNLSITETAPNVGPVNYTYTGTGGVNKFYAGVAYKPIDWLSFGVNASYLFGSINRERTVSFSEDTNGFYNTRIRDAIVVGAPIFTIGIQATKKVFNDYIATLGLVYSPERNIKTSYTQILERYQTNFYGIQVPRDTASAAGTSTSSRITIPTAFAIGASIKNSRWLAGVDIGMQQWNNYQEFGVNGGLKNSLYVSGGVQLLPNENTLTNYFSLIQYRIGGRYSLTPIEVRGVQLVERSVSAGFGFPIVKPQYMGVTYINVGVEAGIMGTSSNGLIKEQFIRFNAGFTFGDKWFVRHKYD